MTIYCVKLDCKCIFAFNYGDSYYPFDPMIVSVYYDEPVIFIRIGTKTFILDEYDDCTKSERPDSFHAVLTDEQPKATFIPKNTGRTGFKIYTNEPGCGFQNECIILAWKDPQGPKESKTNQTFPNDNNDDNNDNNNNNNSNNNNNNSNNNNNNNNNSITTIITNGTGNNVQISAIICNCSVIVFAIIGVVMAHFIL
ncbi:hypothetical protein RhiirC2_714827 [Rhizophagus irregularis]|uniref:Uncharacterized protein n=1 Tax=Rhizophagus irregularis TaxID=588596 RepID=A0A2N1MXS5_9GLOM|nr:hypothetical protein RhiirC2_714827 [Rhizophagus irregularis]